MTQIQEEKKKVNREQKTGPDANAQMQKKSSGSYCKDILRLLLNAQKLKIR